jgi:ppGpp synthetase/RelA/SpoT-type nucleotidyltranferase
MDENQALREYQEKVALWDALRVRFQSLIQDLTRDNPCVHSIESRIKSWPNIARKLAALGAMDLSQITDIVGIRIIVHQRDDVASILQLLEQTLQADIDETYVWRDEPNYRDIHLVASAGKRRKELAE